MGHDLHQIDSLGNLKIPVEELARLILSLPNDEIEFVRLQLRAKPQTGPRQNYESSLQQYNIGAEVSSLTNREVEVLTLISSGYTRREISISLNISQNTAATHISNLYRKLDISSIAEATHLAIRHGLVQLMA